MNSIISLLFYLVIAAVSAVATYLAQKQNRKALLLFPVLLLSLVAGLRSLEVGVDTETYNALFYFTQRMNFSNVTREHLFYYTSVFVLSLFGTTAAVFTVFAFLINTLVFLRLWDFRYSAHLGVAVFLFVTFYFGGTMNGLRQYIAVAILFFATRYLKKRQYIRFLFMLVLAISFHNSAIVACLFPALYIFPQKAYTLKEVLILGITLICVPLSGMMFFHQYAGYYSDAKEAEFGLMGITRLTILLLTYLMFKNAIHVEITDISGFTDNSSFSFVFGICFIGFSLGLSSMIVEYASRMGYYIKFQEKWLLRIEKALQYRCDFANKVSSGPDVEDFLKLISTGLCSGSLDDDFFSSLDLKYLYFLQEAPYIVHEAAIAFQDLVARNWMPTRVPVPAEYAFQEGDSTLLGIQDFIENCISSTPGAEISTADLFQAYCDFTLEDGCYQMNATTFSRSFSAVIKQLIPEATPTKRVHGTDSRGYVNIALICGN